MLRYLLSQQLSLADTTAVNDALARAANDALVRAAHDALARAAHDAPVRADNNALVRAANDAPVRVANDALVRAVNDALVRAVNDALVIAVNNAPARVAIDAPARVAIDAPARVANDAPARVAIDAPARVANDAKTINQFRLTMVKQADTPDMGTMLARVGESMILELIKTRPEPFVVKLKKLDEADKRGLDAAADFQITQNAEAILISLVDVQVSNAGTYRIDCHRETGITSKAFTLDVDAPKHIMILMDSTDSEASRASPPSDRQ